MTTTSEGIFCDVRDIPLDVMTEIRHFLSVGVVAASFLNQKRGKNLIFAIRKSFPNCPIQMEVVMLLVWMWMIHFEEKVKSHRVYLAIEGVEREQKGEEVEGGER